MVCYRRNFIPGGTYFFTVTLANRRSDHLIRHVASLREAFRVARCRYPFHVDAIVILPDHLHTVWTLPVGDAAYPERWRRIKGGFAHALARQGIALSKSTRGEYQLWQARYWEHTIRDATDLARHVDYVHYNPVRHGLVNAVHEWPYSSFHRYVRTGLLSTDWAGLRDGGAGSFGEPT